MPARKSGGSTAIYTAKSPSSGSLEGREAKPLVPARNLIGESGKAVFSTPQMGKRIIGKQDFKPSHFGGKEEKCRPAAVKDMRECCGPDHG
ncbi:hypothetical protein RUND412_002251 [Rhizina undulata]